MGGKERATKTVKISALKNSLARVVNAVSNDEARVLVEKNGVPVAAIVSVSDLRRLVHFDRINRDQEDEEIEREADRAVTEIRAKTAATPEREQEPEDLWAIIDRMREAFKDVPDEEIERETDRIIARIRAENRAAREALATSG